MEEWKKRNDYWGVCNYYKEKKTLHLREKL
jgi:hypothetical protein